MKKIVLVLYSKDFYDQSALAIKEHMSKFYIDYKVVLIEESKYYCTFLSEIDRLFYVATARNLNVLNGLSKAVRQKIFIKNIKKTKPFNQKQLQDIDENKFKARKVKLDNIIARFCPSMIICTTPLSHLFVTKTLKRQQWNIPMYIMITDYCLNKSFYNPYAKGYFVQNNDVVLQLKNKGVSEDKIFISSSVVQKSAMEYYNKQDIRTKYAIDNELPVVTLFGGRYGSGNMKAFFTSLCAYIEKINIVIMTGGSMSFVKFIQNYCKANKIQKNVIIADKISNIAEIYALSDVVLSNPTAQITFETMTRGIPCVVSQGINKVENGNYLYLTSNGYALRGDSPEMACNNVMNLFRDKDYYEQCIDKIGKEFVYDNIKSLCRYINDILVSLGEPQSLSRSFVKEQVVEKENDKIIVLNKKE